MPFHLNTVDILALTLTLCILTSFLRHRRSLALPPGPKGLPVVGNLFDMPSTHQWHIFTEWRHRWGDLVSLNILGNQFVVINSPEHVVALFNKRSALYSDRPELPVAGGAIGWDSGLALSRYGARFREMRRMFAQTMGTKDSMALLAPLIEREEAKLMLRLWRDPNRKRLNPERHLRVEAAAVSLKIAYGYDIKGENDHLVHDVDVAMDVFNKATAPGAYLADTLPFLLRLPEWLPGFGWKRDIIKWREELEETCNMPFQWAKRQMAAGTASPNFTEMHLQDGTDPEREDAIKHAAVAVYAAGADSTVSGMGSFFLAMMLHPEIQKKAQAEIDAVIGRGRVPTFVDRTRLPYVEAIFKEVLRWNPITPLGFFHRLVQDDVYEGYVFPKGTIFIPNVWWFLHDPKTYKDPLAFKPERFLKSTSGDEPEPHPNTYAFGFGRRGCPGQQVGEASIYTACMLALALFEISQGEGEPKMGVDDVKYTSGTVSHPPPFKCCITPRSREAERLLEELETSLQVD